MINPNTLIEKIKFVLNKGNVHYLDNPEFLKRLKEIKEQKPSEVVLLGDSHIYRGKWNEWLNQGIGQGISEGVLARVGGVIRVRPRFCFIQVGVNDLAKGIRPKKVARNIISIANLLKDHTIKTTIFSIFEVHLSYPGATKLNRKVRRVNRLLQAASKNKRKGFWYVVLELEQQHYQSDFIHLNRSGYELFKLKINEVLNSRKPYPWDCWKAIEIIHDNVIQ